MIKDSGERREFKTGALRDMQEGKGRCDLLPLGILADRLESRILVFLDEYVRDGDTHSLWFALDAFIGMDEAQWCSAILDVSKQYEQGAVKYGEWNWTKGIPQHSYIDSAVRHYLKVLRGDDDEPHDRAFIWNILGAIWTHVNMPEMLDLPFAKKGKTQYATIKE